MKPIVVFQPQSKFGMLTFEIFKGKGDELPLNESIV